MHDERKKEKVIESNPIESRTRNKQTNHYSFLFYFMLIKRLQDIITEISEKEKNFKILVYANGFKKIRIMEKIVRELGIDTFAYERTYVGRRRRAMKEKVYYNFNATPNSVLVASDVVSSKVG